MSKQLRIAFLANLAGGGTERVILNLLKELSKRDISLDLVLACGDKLQLDEVPAGVRVINLNTQIDTSTKKALKLVFPLVHYLRKEKPNLLLSHLIYTNVVAVIARTLAGVPMFLAVVEHVALAGNQSNQKEPSSRLLTALMRWLYPQANAVVAVSQGMAQALTEKLRMPQESVQVIYNPVIDESLYQKARVPLEHPWFQPNQPPVILAVGRLEAQKDYPSLLHAFARLREQRPARLLILGEGGLRKKLEALVHQLGLEADVSLPGFVRNPYAYMSRAAVFVLSSRWEGLPMVLIEALACGCQVVATDCPYGPAEILAGGKYGWLVPMGDTPALAEMMQQALDTPTEVEALRQRAQDFSVEQAASKYLQLAGVEII